MTADQRVRWMMRSYPRAWRDRYGDELEALLLDDLADRPRAWRRDLDVVRAGVHARLSVCALADGPVRSPAAVSAVGTAGVIVLVMSALSIWSQLADGWLTARPGSATVPIGLVMLSVWLAALLVVAAGMTARAVAAIVQAVRDGHAAQLLPPLLVILVGADVFVAGLRLVAHRWPVATVARGDSALAHAARTGWAATDAISAFWLHPARLLALPAGELAWMVVSPLAVLAVACGALKLARVVRVADLTPARRGPLPLGVAVLPCVVAAGAWVVGSQHEANATFRAGTLDLALLAGMTVATYAVRMAMRNRSSNGSGPDGGRGGS